MRGIFTRITLGAAILVAIAWGVIGNFSDQIAGNKSIAQSVPGCNDPEFCSRIKSKTIVDAHSDTLLHRNPSRSVDKGHVDLARHLTAGVNLQVFALATFAPKMEPRNGDVCGRRDSINRITMLFIGKEPLRPLTWISHEARIERMLNRFSDLEDDSDNEEPRYLPVRSTAELNGLVARQAAGEAVVGALLAVEGFYWAGRDESTVIGQLERLDEQGVRMISLTQRASNHLAGSSEDCDNRHGLTELGKVVVREMWERGIVLDLAHAAPQVIADIVAMAREPSGVGPIVVSHVGIQKTCPRDRNLSDEDVRNVVRAGGVIGIGFWSWVACWQSEDPLHDIRTKIATSFVDTLSILSHPDFTDEMGPGFDPTRHIALGSDFDGATTMPADVAGLPWIIEGIAQAEREGAKAFSDDALAAIVGGNLLRVISQGLSTRP